MTQDQDRQDRCGSCSLLCSDARPPTVLAEDDRFYPGKAAGQSLAQQTHAAAELQHTPRAAATLLSTSAGPPFDPGQPASPPSGLAQHPAIQNPTPLDMRYYYPEPSSGITPAATPTRSAGQSTLPVLPALPPAAAPQRAVMHTKDLLALAGQQSQHGRTALITAAVRAAPQQHESRLDDLVLTNRANRQGQTPSPPSQLRDVREVAGGVAIPGPQLKDFTTNDECLLVEESPPSPQPSWEEAATPSDDSSNNECDGSLNERDGSSCGSLQGQLTNPRPQSTSPPAARRQRWRLDRAQCTVEIVMCVSMQELMDGCQRSITVPLGLPCEDCPALQQCRDCSGTGLYRTNVKCRKCGGQGQYAPHGHCSPCRNKRYQVKSRLKNVTIKPGTRPGTRLLYCNEAGWWERHAAARALDLVLVLKLCHVQPCTRSAWTNRSVYVCWDIENNPPLPELAPRASDYLSIFSSAFLGTSGAKQEDFVVIASMSLDYSFTAGRLRTQDFMALNAMTGWFHLYPVAGKRDDSVHKDYREADAVLKNKTQWYIDKAKPGDVLVLISGDGGFESLVLSARDKQMSVVVICGRTEDGREKCATSMRERHGSRFIDWTDFLEYYSQYNL